MPICEMPVGISGRCRAKVGLKQTQRWVLQASWCNLRGGERRVKNAGAWLETSGELHRGPPRRWLWRTFRKRGNLVTQGRRLYNGSCDRRWTSASTERFFGLLKVATTTTRAGGSRKSRSTSAMPIWHCFASLPTFAARSRVGTTTKFYLERVLSNHLQSKPTI